MKKYTLSPFFAPVVIFSLWMIFMNTILVFFPSLIPEIGEKNGIIEITTNTMYILMFLSFILFVKDFKNGKMIDFILFVFLGISAFFREMGVQHWLASKDTTAFKSRFFLNPNNPISEKILAGTILIVFFVTVLYLLAKYFKFLKKSFFELETISWSFATFSFMLIIGKIVDRLPSFCKKKYNLLIDLDIRNNLYIVEETSEALLPLIVIIMLWQYHCFKNEKVSK